MRSKFVLLLRLLSATEAYHELVAKIRWSAGSARSWRVIRRQAGGDAMVGGRGAGGEVERHCKALARCWRERRGKWASLWHASFSYIISGSCWATNGTFSTGHATMLSEDTLGWKQKKSGIDFETSALLQTLIRFPVDYVPTLDNTRREVQATKILPVEDRKLDFRVAVCVGGTIIYAACREWRKEVIWCFWPVLLTQTNHDHSLILLVNILAPHQSGWKAKHFMNNITSDKWITPHGVFEIVFVLPSVLAGIKPVIHKERGRKEYVIPSI